MELSENAKVVLLLCYSFQANNDVDEKNRVLSPKEWHLVADLLRRHSTEPQALLNYSKPQLQELFKGTNLTTSVDEIHNLLKRGGTLSLPLENLITKGIKVLTIVDADYPERLKERLGNQAPPFLFYAGDRELLGQPGIAVVGSRHIDQEVLQNTQEFGEICGQAGLVVYSGGAKGVDETCMKAALSAVEGYAVGILAHPLTSVIRTVEYRKAIGKNRLCLATPFNPDKGFQVWKAMYRNAIIYALADYAVVIQSDLEKGGTWAGAKQNLDKGWVPLFVIDRGEKTPAGNQKLIELGGIPLPYPYPFDHRSIRNWLEQRVSDRKAKTPQGDPTPDKTGKHIKKKSATRANQLSFLD